MHKVISVIIHTDPSLTSWSHSWCPKVSMHNLLHFLLPCSSFHITSIMLVSNSQRINQWCSHNQFSIQNISPLRQGLSYQLCSMTLSIPTNISILFLPAKPATSLDLINIVSELYKKSTKTPKVINCISIISSNHLKICLTVVSVPTVNCF